MCLFIGYRLCRRPLKKSAGDDFWSPWLTWAAPCKPFAAYEVHWTQQGSQSRLFGTPVQAGAAISRPGEAGGARGRASLWQPGAPCGSLWRISDTPLRWYKVGCILQPAA